MYRVVLDSNVLISAAADRQSLPGQIMSAWEDGKFILVTSEYILTEIERILLEKFGFTSAVIADLLQKFITDAEIASPWEISVEEIQTNDWPILGTAISGQVDFLVTGDKRLLNLKSFYNILITPPKEFLKML